MKKPVSKFAFQVHNLQRYAAEDVEALAASVPDTGGVYFVPAFSGLFAPRQGGVYESNAVVTHSSLKFMVYGLRFRVYDLGFRVYG